MRGSKGCEHWRDRETGETDRGEQNARGQTAPVRKPRHDIRQPAAVDDPHAETDKKTVDRIERKPAADGKEGRCQKPGARHQTGDRYRHLNGAQAAQQSVHSDAEGKHGDADCVGKRDLSMIQGQIRADRR